MKRRTFNLLMAAAFLVTLIPAVAKKKKNQFSRSPFSEHKVFSSSSYPTPVSRSLIRR